MAPPLLASPTLMAPIRFPRSEPSRSSFVDCLNSQYASKSSNSSYTRRSPTIHRDTSHHHHRKQHRPCCQFGTADVSIFDQLPWISALDQPQENMRDIADLSQIPTIIERSEVPSSGPIRRRRTSSRSNPLAPVEDATVPPIPFPFRDPLPNTPRSRSRDRLPRARFHQLMPVLRSAKCGKGPPSILSVT